MSESVEGLKVGCCFPYSRKGELVLRQCLLKPAMPSSLFTAEQHSPSSCIFLFLDTSVKAFDSIFTLSLVIAHLLSDSTGRPRTVLGNAPALPLLLPVVLK